MYRLYNTVFMVFSRRYQAYFGQEPRAELLPVVGRQSINFNFTTYEYGRRPGFIAASGCAGANIPKSESFVGVALIQAIPSAMQHTP